MLNEKAYSAEYHIISITAALCRTNSKYSVVFCNLPTLYRRPLCNSKKLIANQALSSIHPILYIVSVVFIDSMVPTQVAPYLKEKQFDIVLITHLPVSYQKFNGPSLSCMRGRKSVDTFTQILFSLLNNIDITGSRLFL